MIIYAVFSKNHKKHISFLDEESYKNFPKENFLFKKFEMEGNDLAKYRLIGDYDECRLLNLEKDNKIIITQQEIDYKYSKLLFEKYTENDILLSMHSDDVIAKNIKNYMNNLWMEKRKEIDMYKKSDNYIYETVYDQIKREKDIFN